MPIDFNQLREFIEAIAKTDISELAIKEGDFELTLQKNSPYSNNAVYSIATPVSPPQSITPVQENNHAVEVDTPSTPPAEKSSASKKTDNWLAITSPMVGTFYRAPAPGEPPFVENGDRISDGQVVCIIEAMKLMNEIEAEVSGQIMEIAVENGEPVEYGQTLMWVAPN
ncbi:acetyl-CoA carboxylase biotin carboxyl carrier protein [Cyanobacterium aponinum UTEX 3222]|uniref:Biotin carboxyl carrier protein of acetyl-CoA carboxylase n=3 Tax=Cyanobacterium aponinum TaxID=379064 RepID=K9Z7E3_CYAAP|nr:acetyl-CoA carboxylase biotin carboxyl carrier protein [Cyanobacterium aponinum]MTF38383.1 acetyl-CoA carboxylase biotin carboxyl carrier protein [Cyanobacterium aponinum 0216]WRL43352.1 acetyl-CoA carboxylase biotin carboxyl carrier protein [Cyanobacterium aponinum UTEX 3222]AFZ54657.1 biotin carboxyl carrier protein [Cyanobacterium aponinum PCC 10605]PHV61501.1 acetyl-CoA carboxylase, biotin carboxyl carrier protein [Cyanobacterium aponinum IPPAS B-1201]WPF87956.1 acetyl-CoA carboxylase b